MCLLSDGASPSVSFVTHYSFVRSFRPSPDKKNARKARSTGAGRRRSRASRLERTHMRDALLAALLCGTVRGDDACSSGVCVVAPLVTLTGKRCSSDPTSVHLYELHSTWRRHAAPPSCHPTLCLCASEPLCLCAAPRRHACLRGAAQRHNGSEAQRHSVGWQLGGAACRRHVECSS